MTTTRLGNAVRRPFSSRVVDRPPPKKAMSYSPALTVPFYSRLGPLVDPRALAGYRREQFTLYRLVGAATVTGNFGNLQVICHAGFVDSGDPHDTKNGALTLHPALLLSVEGQQEHLFGPGDGALNGGLAPELSSVEERLYELSHRDECALR